ncbi:MAG: sulfatase [Planctomycetota bacterium]
MESNAARAVRRSSLGPSLLLALTLLTAPSGCTPDRPRGVILISLDTLAADHLKSYGYERDTMPGLDAMLGKGARFETCIAAANWTLPSHMSMLTGVRPRAHGVVTHADLQGPAVPLVSEVLREHGIATAAFAQHTNVSREYGFDRGFDTFAWSEDCQDPEAVLSPAREWIVQHAESPFFAFVHVFAIHWPHLQPDPYRSLFDPGYKGTVQGVQVDVNRLMAERLTPADFRDFEHLEALYDGDARWVDEALTKFLGALGQEIGLNDVLLILTSDHGEAFKEHGYYGHGISFSREELNVPLGLVWPERWSVGRAIPGIVTLLDIPPTILAAFGIDTSAMPHAEGLDLAEVVASGRAPERRLFSESSLAMNQLDFDRFCVLNAGFKYILFPPVERFEVTFGEALYDLSADPWERENLATARAEVIAPFREIAAKEYGFVEEPAFLLLCGPRATPMTIDLRFDSGFVAPEMLRFVSRFDEKGERAIDWVEIEKQSGDHDLTLRVSPSQDPHGVFVRPKEPAGRLRMMHVAGAEARTVSILNNLSALAPLPHEGVTLADLAPLPLGCPPELEPGTIVLVRTSLLVYPALRPETTRTLSDKHMEILEGTGYVRPSK